MVASITLSVTGSWLQPAGNNIPCAASSLESSAGSSVSTWCQNHLDPEPHDLLPEVVELAHQLARARPKGGKRSLREISAELAAAGHVTKSGTPYTATAIKLMLEHPRPFAITSEAA